MSAPFLNFAFYFLLFVLPFGTRKFLGQLAPGEYGAAHLYLSDIAALVFVLTTSFSVILSVSEESPRLGGLKRFFGLRPQNDVIKKTLGLFLLLAATSLFFAEYKFAAAYSFARLALAVAVALSAACVLREKIVSMSGVAAAFVFGAVAQSLIAVAQSRAQASVGLWFLGEPVLKVGEAGVATIVVSGARILRAYGTFPHPNVLGAYLVIGLICLLYLWLSRRQELDVLSRPPPDEFTNLYEYTNKIFLTTGTFLIMLGLALTFSRSAWVAAAVAVVVIISLHFSVIMSVSEESPRLGGLKRFFGLRPQNDVINFCLVLILCAFIVFIILQPFISARSDFSFSAPAIADRIAYNRVAWEIVKSNPLGAGVGNQVFYAERHGLYEKFGLTKPWQHQPAHNIYLLIASEIGIMGFLLFVFFVCVLIFRLSFQSFDITKDKLQQESSTTATINNGNAFIADRRATLAMVFALLISGLFDHFLWDLWPGQLLLWLMIGLMVGLLTQNNADTVRRPMRTAPALDIL